MEGLYGLILKSARSFPDKAFVYSMDRVWTYHEVACLAENISEYMLEYGVEKGDRVVIFCNNSIQYIGAFFGTLRSKAVAVPVNPARMAESLLYIAEKCSPRLIIACASTVDKLEKIRGSLGADIINIDDGNIWGSHDRISDSGDGRDFTAAEDDIAEILFTSGTTADPKGVTLTHGSLMANTTAIVDYLKLTWEDSVLMTLPFTYSYGNSVLLTHAFAGASIIIENAAAFPCKVLEEIKKYRVSGFSTVGSYMKLMVKYLKNSDIYSDCFNHLRYITLAGEATHNDDILFINRNYPDVKVYVMYGQTEASARLSYLSPEMLPCRLGSVGKGLSNVRLRVVDEGGRDIKPGELGEIIAHGPNIMKGYWEDPAATEEVLKEDWLYTGDSATVDEDGYIYIKGRKSDMIKHMGHRISPAEVEDAINRCSCVRESAVIEGNLDGMPVIKAFIVPEKEFSMNEIKSFIFARLPVYMRPSVFVTTDELPRTDSGKIMRSALRRSECAELRDL